MLTVVAATSFRARLRGLALRRDAPPGVALELPRCASIHTFGMRFALDLVWLDRDRRVVRIDRAVPPGRVVRCRGAAAVVEVASPARRVARAAA